MFNLPPPPGFRGLDPDRPVTKYVRNLPHRRQEGATYFVTFRQVDSLPQDKLALLQRIRAEWERAHPPPRTDKDWESLAREVTDRAERWLDAGYGACHFREKGWADQLKDRLIHFQDQRYRVSCWAIMPNHAHVVIRPEPGFELEDLIGTMKHLVARRINVALGLSGPVWQEESYDRIIRDEEHLWRVIQYIGRNPRLAGLENELWRRWIHPEWLAVGWDFRDEG